MYQETFESPVGPLTVCANSRAVTAVRIAAGGEDRPNAITGACIRQLREYFAGTRQRFDLPLEPAGTAFQLRVWEALRTIPFGSFVTYGALARQISCKSARAVGQAVGRNPVLILLPCHRVLAADGGIGGFSAGLPMKKFLLNLEKIPETR